MRTIELTYDIMTACGFWDRRKYITNDGKDWERVVDAIHANPDTIRVINVKHAEEAQQ